MSSKVSIHLYGDAFDKRRKVDKRKLCKTSIIRIVSAATPKKEGYERSSRTVQKRKMIFKKGK